MRVKIKELGDIITGNTPSKKNLEFWDSNDICFVKPDIIADEGITAINKSNEYISETARSKARVVGKNTLFVTCIGSIGKIGIAEDGEYAFNQQINAVVPNATINARYLAYAILYSKPQLVAIANSAVVPIINKSQFGDFEINIVEDIQQQEEMVNILDRTKGIVEARQQELQKLDELIKARFVEMFGDLEDTIRLGDCCEVHARIGWQALTRDEHMKTGQYMLVTGTDFKDGLVNYDTCAYVAKERYEMDQHIILKENDVLITKDGSIGKVAVVHNLPKPATLNGGVFVVRPDDRFNKEYISYVFRGPLFERFVDLSKTGATIKHLNQKHLVEFAIPLPSIEEQFLFAQFSKKIDKSKVVVQKALDEAQLLFDSLMQEYFG